MMFHELSFVIPKLVGLILKVKGVKMSPANAYFLPRIR